MIVLRPYQRHAADFTVQYACDNIRGRLLVVMPPGGGKTPFMAHVLRVLAAEQGLRGLAWAHRRELVGQAYDHLIECGIPEKMISVVMSGDKRYNPTAPIQVASVDTLRSKNKPLADIVVSDEAHRDASDGRRKLRALYPDAFHLGLTATPIRLDGRGLKDDYDDMHVAATPSQLMVDGYIVAPRIYTVPEELLPDLNGIKKRAGDFSEEELEDRSNRRVIIGGIVDHWQRRAENRRTIVFAVGIRHSKAIVERFKASGIAAAHLDGETSRSERDKTIRDLQNGVLKIISSCGVLSEGVNLPEVKCVVQARATHSLALCIQQAGRCMRPWANIEPLLLDHSGNVRRHGMPQEDRAWSLNPPRARGCGIAPVKICDNCQLVVNAGNHKCPECGHVFVQISTDPTEEIGDLVEYKRTHTEQEQRDGWAHISQFASSRGIPETWAVKVYVLKFGLSALPPGR